jgi:putative lipoprotein
MNLGRKKMSRRLPSQILILLVSGFAIVGMLAAQERPQAPVTPAKPDEPARPQSPERPRNNIRRAIEWKRIDYTCDGGAKVTVSLSGTMARVRYQDHTYLMKETESREGARFSDGKLVWWSRDKGAFLQDNSPAGYGKMLVQDCRPDKEASPSTGVGVVIGTVSYRGRMALPSHAVVEVQLQDDLQADAASKIVTEEKITVGQNQVPVPFELNFDPQKIDAKHKYSVTARILVDGSALFASDKSYPVLTQGHPSHVDLTLKKTEASQPK